MSYKLFLLALLFVFLGELQAQSSQYFIDINDDWLLYQKNNYIPYYEGAKSKTKHIFVSAESNSPRYLILQMQFEGSSVFFDNVLIKKMLLDTLFTHRIDTFTSKSILVTVYNRNGVENTKAFVSSTPTTALYSNIESNSKKFLQPDFVQSKQADTDVFFFYFTIFIVNLFISPLKGGFQWLWSYLNGITSKPIFRNYDFFYLLYFIAFFSLNILVVNNLVDKKGGSFFSFTTLYSFMNVGLFTGSYFLMIGFLSSIFRKRQLASIHILESITTLHIFLMLDAGFIFFFTLRPDYIQGFVTYIIILQYITYFFAKLILVYRLNAVINDVQSLKIIYICITELVPFALFLSFFVKT